MPAAKHVVVILRRPPQHPRTAHALRSAVGYLTADLRVTLVLAGPAEALWPLATAPSPALSAQSALVRPLVTLRALGQQVVLASAIDLPALVAAADAVIPW